jgi:hypothetical protein
MYLKVIKLTMLAKSCHDFTQIFKVVNPATKAGLGWSKSDGKIAGNTFSSFFTHPSTNLTYNYVALSDESTLRSKDIMKVFHLISRPTL